MSENQGPGGPRPGGDGAPGERPRFGDGEPAGESRPRYGESGGEPRTRFGGGAQGGRPGGGDGDRDRRGPRRGGSGGGRYGGRRKVCVFCADNIEDVDYKDIARLRRHLSERGKIEPRRKLGTCARHQRSLTAAIKRARHLALLPYVSGGRF